MWEPSRENGAQIDFYVLEGKRDSDDRVKRETNLTWDKEEMDVSRTSRNIDEDWVLVYNGTGKNIYVWFILMVEVNILNNFNISISNPIPSSVTCFVLLCFIFFSPPPPPISSLSHFPSSS